LTVYQDNSGGGNNWSPTLTLTADSGAPINLTWQTRSQPGNIDSSLLTNWIPSQYGATYTVKAYVAPSGCTTPQTGGTQILQAGSGINDGWFFDYQAGILNFNGSNVPPQLGNLTSASGNVVYLSGVRYTGLLGVTNLPNINITGNIGVSGYVSAVGNITGNYILGNGALLTGVITSVANINNGTSNVTVVSSGGNITVGVGGTGNVAVFSTTGEYVTGLISASGNITGGNLITGGLVSATGTITSAANISGGNVLTVGLVSATGNVYGNAILSNNYYYANGTPVPPGIVYTAAVSPPGAPKVTDQWYDTASDVLYEFLNDGTSTYWVDTTSPAFAGGVVANVAISGTLLPVANVTYDIGTSTAYFRNTYTQNLYTNNRLPAYNMPLGAVVQTVMSSSLGGSTTNSTGYADISYANVTITPSSATSKVLIIATGTSEFSAVSGFGVTSYTQLVRGASTSLQVQNTGTSGTGGTDAGAIGAISYSYLDAPATTSPVTYKLQQKISTASSTLTSTNIWLIAMEITAS
jgi:hypothetical protein